MRFTQLAAALFLAFVASVAAQGSDTASAASSMGSAVTTASASATATDSATSASGSSLSGSNGTQTSTSGQPSGTSDVDDENAAFGGANIQSGLVAGVAGALLGFAVL
ncbi:hypothetical protein EV715DRAFT_260543 [Schizophyllum commune]